MGPEVEQVFLRAAAAGDPQAQSTLAVAFLNRSDDLAESDPVFAEEFLASAELVAVMAYEHPTKPGRAHDAAILGAIVAVRSIRCAERDPVRSLDYRQWAERLFDAVEAGSDEHAKGIVAWALNRLADAGDEAAAARLNSVMETLSPAEARLVANEVRREAKEPAQVNDGGNV